MIRRDLFAVKVYGDPGVWCYEGIFRTPRSARNYKTVAEAPNRHFPLVPVKIVHPDQRIVDAFVCAGNEIKE